MPAAPNIVTAVGPPNTVVQIQPGMFVQAVTLIDQNGNFSPGFTLQASTGVGGFALQNGTPAILTWTAPNDGQMHRVTIFGQLWITSAETGGQLSVSITDPGGHASGAQTVDAGGHGVNFHQLSSGYWSLVIAPGSTVTLSQSSALIAGAATLWAEIWGS